VLAVSPHYARQYVNATAQNETHFNETRVIQFYYTK